MITIQITETAFWDNQAEGYIFFMNEGLSNSSDLSNLSKIEREFYPHVKALLKKHEFEGKKGQSFALTAMHKDKFIEFIFVGLGKGEKVWHVELEILRRAIGQTVHILKKKNITNAILAMPEETVYKIDRGQLLKQMVMTAYMAAYEFVALKTSTKPKAWQTSLLIEVRPDEAGIMSNACEHGTIIGNAINKAREWADTPANIMTPTALAEQAQKIADKHGFKCTVFGREKALELGMGAFCSVDAGSDQDGKFVVLEHKAKSKDASTIALVGKGVMFDTGGISLKPSNSMSGMKFDMSGAACVLAVMDILGHIKTLDLNVIALTPLVENMPSGKATRQDDVVVAMNGKTIEIKNTDAEGRLILADALCYAEKFYSPDVMIDVATLTGACSYALGFFYSGLMTQDEHLQRELPELGQLTGDRIWPLPLDDDFKPANKSDVADVSNSGSSAYKAGTIIGACFLSEFVKKARWAHIDIAGTADNVPDINYLGKTASGAGIRLLTEYVMSFSELENRKK
ncbi:MAG: leucyl aminopeptidase [bacterium]